MSTNKAELEPLNRNITLPGVHFAEHGLEFDGEPSPDTVHALGRMLQRIDSCGRWWQGDFLRVYAPMHRRPARGHETVDEQRQMELVSIGEYAEACGLRRDRLVDDEEIARFFPMAERRRALTFDHHAEAYGGAKGDYTRAAGWLDLAIERKWSVAQLRAHIRKQNAIAAAGDEDAGPLPDADAKLDTIELWAAQRIRRAGELKAREARELLARMPRTVELVDALRHAAGIA